MKKILFCTLLLIFSLSNLSALCTDVQIDINSASLKLLDELEGIGPAKAQAIIDARPFSSVDELLRVKGIGPTTLNKIKFQGLACVGGQAQTDESNETEDVEDSSFEENEESEEPVKYYEAKNTESTTSTTGNSVQETIKLNPPDSKDIKSEKAEFSDTKKYATYGFVAFLVFLALLFILKRNSKNEII